MALSENWVPPESRFSHHFPNGSVAISGYSPFSGRPKFEIPWL